ncbi:MAG: DUF1003 domain-containing protein [Chitinophagaceae bacterium]|nr:DUF1003 domain-containing protein [Chitinophagaceae bacterium]
MDNKCFITQKTYPGGELFKAAQLRKPLFNFIREHYPGFNETSLISIDALQQQRKMYIEALLRQEIGELTDVEKEVVSSIMDNLVLSCLAAIQAPVIMMSQNRQEAKDRSRAEHDYKINLKAELEIRLLHEKIDHLLINQNLRLMEVQQTQNEMVSQLAKEMKKEQT